MKDPVKNHLRDLIALLKNPSVKGKQAAFNACFEQLTRAKALATWETIVKIIEDETSIKIDASTASNMYGRSKHKITPTMGNSTINPAIPHHSAPSGEKTIIQKEKTVSSPADLRRLRANDIDLDDLLE